MFKIKSVENKKITTRFRMNAEKLSMKTTMETLGRYRNTFRNGIAAFLNLINR